ncbi:E3 ubiquitin-protein ligase RNF181-like [Tubulanus polymorphus]|uniref:E3 ubiquitin-protein ligase RNF181-like n=1 Tax=Tubulanus polymorphus TaxID=672921 RepID=UPI003DA22C96
MMACYFDEHNCQPLKDGEQPNHLLHLARLLLDSGLIFEEEFAREKPPPPASKKVVEELPVKLVTPSQAEAKLSCPICLLEFDEEDETREMPCNHRFHPRCILPWLGKTNTCPVCRHELPTDDAEYEQYRKYKAGQKQREHDLQTLHSSMFG